VFGIERTRLVCEKNRERANKIRQIGFTFTFKLINVSIKGVDNLNSSNEFSEGGSFGRFEKRVPS
jgi:hypothetical protein